MITTIYRVMHFNPGYNDYLGDFVTLEQAQEAEKIEKAFRSAHIWCVSVTHQPTKDRFCVQLNDGNGSHNLYTVSDAVEAARLAHQEDIQRKFAVH